MQDLSHIFKAYDIRGKVRSELTPELVHKIAVAFSNWLPEKGPVVVGRDMRPDSEELARSFIAGILDTGRNAIDVGQITSDMAYFAIGKYSLAGGAVITASHNAGDDNGIKLYREKVTPVGLDSGLSEIRDLALSGPAHSPVTRKGQLEKQDILAAWISHCLTFVDTLPNYTIAIDTGNGMAGLTIPEIAKKLPLTIEPLYFEIDGTFPNHEANPQVHENLVDLIAVVVSKKLDFGIAFDGDGDRAVFVDDKGRVVLGTDLMTIVARLYLEKYPGTTIVHDVRTSRATRELITKWGGTPVRTKAGRVNVGSKLREVSGAFGGETTGHFFYKENYEADSGLIVALTAMQALSNSGKKLSQLVDEYRLYAMLPEQNILTKKTKDDIFSSLKEHFVDGSFDELDGLTVEYPLYWFNLRASNTEPVLRLNAEAKDQTTLDEVVAKVTSLINT